MQTCLFKGTNNDPLVQVIWLKIEPLGSAQFSFSLEFLCLSRFLLCGQPLGNCGC